MIAEASPDDLCRCLNYPWPEPLSGEPVRDQCVARRRSSHAPPFSIDARIGATRHVGVRNPTVDRASSRLTVQHPPERRLTEIARIFRPVARVSIVGLKPVDRLVCPAS